MNTLQGYTNKEAEWMQEEQLFLYMCLGYWDIYKDLEEIEAI